MTDVPSSTGGPDDRPPDHGPSADVPGEDRRGGARGRIDDLRVRADDATTQAGEWFEDRRRRLLPYDLAAMFYERDRDTFASVLGAALAMRLFLFLVPFVVVLVGLVLAVIGPEGIDSAVEGAGITGTMADQIRDATETTRTGGILLAISGTFLALGAGRSLTRVLAACSAGAWRITGKQSKATLRMAGSVTALIAFLLVLTALMNRVREQFPLPLATTSWIASIVAVTVAWFAVTWSLPRGTRDPGALLPGAVLTGVSLSAVQWFMQYYLPGRIERASDLTGSLGITVAALGYLFVIGRIMSSSLILNAVVYERVGSVSELFFGLPVLRRIPARSPQVARFFDLHRGDAPATEGPDTTPSTPDALADEGATPPPPG